MIPPNGSQPRQVRFNITFKGLPLLIDPEQMSISVLPPTAEPTDQPAPPATHFAIATDALSKIAITLFQLRGNPALKAQAERCLSLFCQQIDIDPDSVPTIIIPGVRTT